MVGPKTIKFCQLSKKVLILYRRKSQPHRLRLLFEVRLPSVVEALGHQNQKLLLKPATPANGTRESRRNDRRAEKKASGGTRDWRREARSDRRGFGVLGRRGERVYERGCAPRQ